MLNRYGCHIQFAHRTFRWSNEARGNAAVYCIIVGYGIDKLPNPRLFDYATPNSAPQEIPARSINPYLVDGPEVLVVKRSKPLSMVPVMRFGSMPIDGGNLLMLEDEKDALIDAEPEAARFIRRFVGAEEFINQKSRYCLWMLGITPSELKSLPRIMERIEGVRKARLESVRPATQQLAVTPTLFGFISQPDTDYLLVPGVSSENRRYIPIGFMSKEVVASNLVNTIPNATPYLFGILTSEMHMAWMRQVCGRLKSDFRYSGTLVYNNYPFPPNPTEGQRAAVAAAAEAVLAARALFPTESLAALYDPSTMPPALARAHATLDRAVDRCYRPAAFATELARLEFLFGLYQQLSAPVLGAAKKGRQAKG
ncbi:hypothetical protein J7E24_04420 [Hymenobacter sp. ISL-91]|nr:hypothetical protein [Hymenobacter sp. ISL-91]